MKRIFVSLLLLALLFPPQLLAEEGPKLIVGQDVLKFYCQPVCEKSQPFSFRLYSQGGVVEKLQVIPKEIKNPEGMPLPQEALSVEKETGQVTGEGTNIKLSIENKDFMRPGDYTITILIKGEVANKSVELLKSLTITRPAAAINLDELKDWTIKLGRPFPWWGRASGKCILHLRDQANKAAISNLTVCGLNVFQDKTKVLVPGEVKAVIAEENKGKSQCLPAQEEVPVTVTFSGLEQTGDFTTGVLVQSPSFSGPCTIPLKLQITDWGVWPFLVILLGVLGGFGTRYLAKRFKPSQENNLRIVRIRGILDHWQHTARKPEKETKVIGLQRQLLAAEEKNNLGDSAGARTLLDQLERDLGTYQTAEDADFIRVSNDLAKLRAQLHSFINKVPYAERKNFNDILTRLLDVESALSQEEFDLAEEILRERRTEFLQQEFSSLKTQIGTFPKENQDKLKPLISDIQVKFDSDSLDEVEAKLKNLEQEMQKITAGPQPAFASALQEAEDEPDIKIEYKPESCTVGTKVNFIIRPKKLMSAKAQVDWNFGDNTPTESRPLNDYLGHRYDSPGKYKVESQVMLDGQLTDYQYRWINILPSRTEALRAGIMDNLKRADWTISAVALILAALSGLIFLYVGKPFGSLQDYLKAFLWGFGVDNGVNGFAEVMKKISE